MTISSSWSMEVNVLSTAQGQFRAIGVFPVVVRAAHDEGSAAVFSLLGIVIGT